MNNVHNQEEQFHEYLDGEMSKLDRKKFELHLKECGQCQQELDKTQALFTAIESIPEIEILHDYSPSLVSRLKPTSLFSKQGNWLVAFQFLAATIFLIIAIPTLMESYPLPDESLIDPNLFEVISTIPEQIDEYIEMVFDGIDTMLLHLDSLNTQDPVEFTTTLIWPMLAAATLLWFVGNGILLRKNTLT